MFDSAQWLKDAKLYLDSGQWYGSFGRRASMLRRLPDTDAGRATFGAFSDYVRAAR